MKNIQWPPVRYISQEFDLSYNTIYGIANPLKAKAAESDLKEQKYFHLFFFF